MEYTRVDTKTHEAIHLEFKPQTKTQRRAHLRRIYTFFG